jgi:hypothetical protein
MYASIIAYKDKESLTSTAQVEIRDNTVTSIDIGQSSVDTWRGIELQSSFLRAGFYKCEVGPGKESPNLA